MKTQVHEVNVRRLVCSLASTGAMVLASLLGTAVNAQVSEERSYVAASARGVFAVDRVTGAAATIAGMPGLRTAWLGMHEGNDAMAAIVTDVESGSPAARLVRIGLDSRLAPLADLGPLGRRVDATLDQDGQYVIVSALQRALFKTAGPRHEAIVPHVRFADVPTAVCRDDDTGDFVVGTAEGDLLRVDAQTFEVTTMRKLDSIRAIDHNQRTGDLVVVTDGVAGAIIVRPNQSDAPIFLPGILAVYCDDLTGHVHFAREDGVVTELNAALDVVDHRWTPAGDLQCLLVWGQRKLAPLKSSPIGQAGLEQIINGAFVDSPNRPFYAAIGMSGLRAGVAVDTRSINLALDPLVGMTVGQSETAFTKGFTGVTTPAGTFAASFVLPREAMGQRIVFAAVTVNPAKPSQLDIAPSLSIAIAP